MANATPRDTRAGFDIYLSAGGAISLDDLNRKLQEAGYGPVANRTLAHYRKLVKFGYTRYISINRLDVARAATPFTDLSAKARYDFREVDLGVNVIFAKASRLYGASGRATEIGDVGAVIRFEDSPVIEGLTKMKPQPGDMITIRYLEAGRSASGRVVEVDLSVSPALVEVEYAGLLPISSIGTGDQLPVTQTRFVLGGDVEQAKTLDVVSQRLYLFFEFIEAIRAVSNKASERLNEPAYAPPVVLKRLSVASPADLLVELAPQLVSMMPWALVATVARMAWMIPEKRKTWLEGSGQVKQNTLQDLEIEQRRMDVEAKKAEAALRTAMIQRVYTAFPATDVSDEELARWIDDLVLPTLRALGRSGIFAVDVGEDVGKLGPA